MLRPQLEAHLALLARMAALCRQHGVTLTVVTSPLNRLNARDYDPAELARVAERIARVVPLWDFGMPDWLSDRGDLWSDPSHFKPEVGDMMLGRVFGAGTGSRRLRHVARRLKPHGCPARCARGRVDFPFFSAVCNIMRQIVTVI